MSGRLKFNRGTAQSAKEAPESLNVVGHLRPVNDETLRYKAAILGGFLILSVLAFSLAPVAHDVLRKVITLRSEYTVWEQASKFYILIVMFTSVLAFQSANKPSRVKISVSLFLVSFASYVAEADMMTDLTKPIVELAVFGYASFLLLTTRSWSTLLLLWFGLGLLIVGLSADGTFVSKLPSRLSEFVAHNVHEEMFEAAGWGFVCFAAIYHTLDEITIFIKGNVTGVLLLLVTLGVLASGDSFMSWFSGAKIRIVGLTMAVVGFVLTNRCVIQPRVKLVLVSEGFLYLFAFSLLVTLPAVFRGPIHQHSLYYHAISLILWIPAILFLGLYLYNHHPARTRNG